MCYHRCVKPYSVLESVKLRTLLTFYGLTHYITASNIWFSAQPEMQYCKEEGPLAHTNIIFSCVKGTIVLTFVRHIKHAKWRGSGLSYLSLLRSKAAIAWDPVGLLLERPQEDRMERDWSVSLPRRTEKQSAGRLWPVLGRSEWWSLG